MCGHEGFVATAPLCRYHNGVIPRQTEAGKGQADRRGRGPHFQAARPEALEESPAHAEEPRVARGEDADAPAVGHHVGRTVESRRQARTRRAQGQDHVPGWHHFEVPGGAQVQVGRR